MKEFNTTGVCVPEKHYMADTSDMVREIATDLVAKGKYFTMNRARQYGKTTTLYMLNRFLSKDYLVIQISFEAIDDYFESLAHFVRGFVLDVADALRRNKVEEHIVTEWEMEESEQLPLRQLGKKITELCESVNKEVVLIIDEVDKSSDNQIFLSFLGLLRDKYLKQVSGQDTTFKSAILAGVYDIKNMKLKLRSTEEHKYNSPWNIAVDFNIDMALSTVQIQGMLKEYVDEHEITFDTKWFAEQIYEYTAGYPYLVSRICSLLSKETSWSREDFQKTIKKIVTERSTLFDDINKNIELYPILGEMIKGLLLQGKEYAYTLSDNMIQLGTMFGYFENRKGLVVISNRIFEMYLYDMFYKAVETNSVLVSESNIEKEQFIQNGQLDMNYIIKRFATHFHNLYQEKEQEFLEEQCRFLFLTFLRPIINSSGNYYIEARTRDQKRMDVIVDYHGKQYIIELKIWRGGKYQQEGRKQLAEYLDIMECDEGYLLTFSFLKEKDTLTDGKENIVNGKKIYEWII